MVLNRTTLLYWFVLSLYNLSNSIVIATSSTSNLLDANRVPLAALNSPGNFYFLEFPVNENDSKLSPICADGSPYSFAFRRGTDDDISKILIEFEGGPACWNNSSGSSCCDIGGSSSRKQAPWYDYLDYFSDQVVFQKTFPELGSCRGISSGFLTEAADVILSKNNAITNDLPIPLRGDQGQGWWGSLGGRGSDIRDWSYILLPHCSLDWHLGHQEIPQVMTSCSATEPETVYHRGGTNVDAVIKWIHKQFPSGLDALITTAGGQIGGCSNNSGPIAANSIAPAILASKLSSTVSNEDSLLQSRSSALAVIEGSDFWNPGLPTPEIMASRWNAIDIPPDGGLPERMETLVASSINRTQFIWIASDEGKVSDEERLWYMRQTNIHQDRFHIYEPRSTPQENEEKLGWCPIYTFPVSTADFSDFFANVIERMSWSSVTSSTSNPATKETTAFSTVASASSGDTRSRLTFLTIFFLLCGVVVLAWVIYYIVAVRNSQNGRKVTLSPTDIWFIALTDYPLAFYLVSLLIPIVLTTIAFSRNDLKINLNFDSYLEVNTDLENVKRNYDRAQENQQASLEMEETYCRLYGNSIFGNRNLLDETDTRYQINDEARFVEEPIFGNRNLLDQFGLDIQVDQMLPLEMLSTRHRDLSKSNLNYFSGGEWISIMYQNRNGGNVFEPDVLRAIYEFESSIFEFPGFQDHCFGLVNNQCLPIDSLVSYFFNNGELVSDLNSVLRSFLVNQPALWKLDQYFGPNNLQSNVTRSFVFLKNVGGDQSAAHPFLRSFYRDFLLENDRKKSYPAMVHTWNNFVMKQTEADDALLHDTLWSIGSLCFIALMILLKVKSFFLVFSSMLGLILAFSVSYYWVSSHFVIQDITLIWVAGLFVMLGIGADDIFLMVDSFDHTKHEYEEDAGVFICHSDISVDDNDTNDRKRVNTNVKILKQRMIVAYKRAGSMMLVSSVTTAICFFSNAFGVLTVIQEFGIYMGMVVLINYVHVMTILPSAILVDEIYVAPLQKEFIKWCKSKFFSKSLEKQNQQGQCTEKLAHLKEPDDAILTKCFQDHASERHEKLENIVEKASNDMNNLDRYLVQTYAPLVAGRSSYLIVLPIVLAIILGLCGAINVSLNDGTIVLYSNKYNLGRLETVTKLYFNDDEDVYTTIEDDTHVPTSPPTPVPQDLNFIPPEEHLNTSLSGAATLPPENIESSNSDHAAVSGGSTSQQVGSFDPNEPSSGSSYSGSKMQQGTPSGSGIPSNKRPATGSIPKPTSDHGMRRRETIQVKLIWGIESVGKKPSLWITNSDGTHPDIDKESIKSASPSLNLAEPRTQEWLLEVVEMAKTNTQLFVRRDKLTWIERLRDFAPYAGVEFPIPEHLFTTYIQLLKLKDPDFADLIRNAIGTRAPGLGGDFTFASITMMVDAVESGEAAQNISMSEYIYKEWTDFTAEVNELSPAEVPPVIAQSSIFLDAYRLEALINSTLMTWFVANGLCLIVILVFIQNLALSAMIMVTITLVLFCLGGLIFAVFHIPFGPVEALGVSIFIGLSANYSLHIVHAYHHSTSGKREIKIKEAIFAVGSPIIASAISTMGASAFLFWCRTWVFIELGLLICSITGMALLFTMTFLSSWLASAGPLPVDQHGSSNSQQWDLRVLCSLSCLKARRRPTVDTKSELHEDNESEYSIEIVEDIDNDFTVLRKHDAEMTEDDDDDGAYSISIEGMEDLNGDMRKVENGRKDLDAEGTNEFQIVDETPED